MSATTLGTPTACEWQHCLNVDARFSALRFQDPSFRTLYLRRRRQLLVGTNRTRDYLKMRSSILQNQFGNGMGSMRGSVASFQQDSSFQSVLRTSSASRHRGPSSVCSQSDTPSRNSLQSVSPSASSKPPPPPTTYAFNGMFHLFDDHTKPVTRMFFFNDDKSRLATASADGRVVIRQILPPPASIVAVLPHTCPVYDMDCSETNELLVTSAADATVRLWSVAQAICIRSITLSSPHMPNITRFLPLNNNFIMVGTSKQTVQLINISTGRMVKRGTCRIDGQALSSCFHPSVTSRAFWIGDETGCLYSFSYDMAVSNLTRTSKLNVGQPVRTLACRPVPSFKRSSRKASNYDLLLLLGTSTNLWIFCVNSQLVISSGLSSTSANLQAIYKPLCQIPITLSGSAGFAPLQTSSRWVVLAAGSTNNGDNLVSLVAIDSASVNQDSTVVTGSPTVLTALPGHSAPITSLHFSYDESLLASSDDTGTVIVWRR